MGTEEGMGKAHASCVGSDDVLQVESKRPRAFFYFFLFFLVGVHFFQGLDEVDIFDESLSSLSRLG